MRLATQSMQRVIAATLAALIFLSGCHSNPKKPPPPTPPPKPPAESIRFESVRWSELPGWENDQADEAWNAFLNSCKAKNTLPAMMKACAAAQPLTVVNSRRARSFFESNFTPYFVTRLDKKERVSETGLVTGYYEPVLRGSRKASATFATALYAPPSDMFTIELGDAFPELQGKRVRGRLIGKKVVPYFDRAALLNHPSLTGRELVWVDSPVDAFFMEVQGSGRVQLNDGTTIRLAYADQNGRPYRSIGKYLVDLGELKLEESTAPAIRRWIDAHPARMREVLNANPSVVFFREERIEDPAQGPKGTLGVPLTAGRSLAVDTAFIPLGVPVFLATTYPASTAPLQRLVMAQDTGGDIRGPLRADLFWGFGQSAGESAGLMKQQGQLWVLWPRGSKPPNQ